jgi:hypothetical protein
MLPYITITYMINCSIEKEVFMDILLTDYWKNQTKLDKI